MHIPLNTHYYGFSAYDKQWSFLWLVIKTCQLLPAQCLAYVFLRIWLFKSDPLKPLAVVLRLTYCYEFGVLSWVPDTSDLWIQQVLKSNQAKIASWCCDSGLGARWQMGGGPSLNRKSWEQSLAVMRPKASSLRESQNNIWEQCLILFICGYGRNKTPLGVLMLWSHSSRFTLYMSVNKPYIVKTAQSLLCLIFKRKRKPWVSTRNHLEIGVPHNNVFTVCSCKTWMLLTK